MFYLIRRKTFHALDMEIYYDRPSYGYLAVYQNDVQAKLHFEALNLEAYLNLPFESNSLGKHIETDSTVYQNRHQTFPQIKTLFKQKLRVDLNLDDDWWFPSGEAVQDFALPSHTSEDVLQQIRESLKFDFFLLEEQQQIDDTFTVVFNPEFFINLNNFATVKTFSKCRSEIYLNQEDAVKGGCEIALHCFLQHDTNYIMDGSYYSLEYRHSLLPGLTGELNEIGTDLSDAIASLNTVTYDQEKKYLGIRYDGQISKEQIREFKKIYPLLKVKPFTVQKVSSQSAG